MYNKIFHIGMFKTGIQSTARALRKLGFKVSHRPWWDNTVPIDNYDLNHSIWKDYTNQIVNKVESFDALCDYPWMYLYKEADGLFPNSKFILTVRNIDSVVASSIKPELADGTLTPEKKEIFRQRYLNHLAGVIEYFRDDTKLLIMNLSREDGYPKLCPFLERPIKRRSFPHVNKTKIKSTVNIFMLNCAFGLSCFAELIP